MRLTEKELLAVRNLSRKQGRRESGLFMAEGVRCVRELLASDYKLDKLIICESLLTGTGREFFESLKFKPRYELNAQKFRSISSEKSSQGIIAVAKRGDHKPLKPKSPSLIFMIQRMSDPSNLGSLIRSAAAFGAGLIIGSESADIYSPKVISASSGYIFHAEIELCETVIGKINFLKRNSYRIWGADNSGEDICGLNEIPERLAVAVGNEAFGLQEDIRQKLDLTIRIPIMTGIDSLSAPIAGSILMQRLSWRMGLVK